MVQISKPLVLQTSHKPGSTKTMPCLQPVRMQNKTYKITRYTFYIKVHHFVARCMIHCGQYTSAPSLKLLGKLYILLLLLPQLLLMLLL